MEGIIAIFSDTKRLAAVCGLMLFFIGYAVSFALAPRGVLALAVAG
jgi:hypothetical protein